jgi:hypothetical protein
MSHAGRNDACPCGSGKKYKKCCELKPRARSNQVMLIVVGLLMAAGVAAGIAEFVGERNHVGTSQGVWSAEHGHYH